MNRIRAFVIDLHRRSLWQVLGVYLASSWFVLQVAEHVVERFLLPEWVYAGAVLLLLLGLPVVLATALVNEERGGEGAPSRVAPASEKSKEAPRPHAQEASAPGGSHPPGAEGLSSLATLHRRLRSGPLETILTWPRALAGGLLAFCVLALIGGFFYVQGVPRIAEARGSAGDAFQERSWILVTDFEATGEEDRGVALAVREALTVDLQQSEHVNVLARSQIAGVLRRMDLPDTTAMSLPLGLEVAQRFGAGAVLTASVSRLGPQYVVSGRALDPISGEELFAVRVAAAEARLLEGVESLSREVRRRLGESRGTIRQSLPLPEVTTRSLEALKTYAEAERALSQGEHEQAAVLAAEAVRIDSTFAMAHRMAAVSASNQQRMGEGRRHATRAYESRERLSDRERWHVEALYQQLVVVDPRATLDLYELILNRYPDDFRATNNMGSTTILWMSDPAAAATWTERAHALDPNSLLTLNNLAEARGLTGRLDEVDRLLPMLKELGGLEVAGLFRIRGSLARGDLEGVRSRCDSILGGPSGPSASINQRQLCGSMDLVMGRLGAARNQLEDLHRQFLSSGLVIPAFQVLDALATAERTLVGADASGRRLERFLQELDPEGGAEPDRFLLRTTLQVKLELMGLPGLSARVEEILPSYPDPEHWLARQGASLVAAARAVAGKDGAAALDALRSGEAGGRQPIHWALLRGEVRARALQLVGQPDSAVTHLRPLVEPGWVSFAYPPPPRGALPGLLLLLAELEEERGDLEAAASHYRRLLALWSHADPEVTSKVQEVEGSLRLIEERLATR